MFYDTDNNPLPSYEQTVNPGSTIVFLIQADCKAGKFLRCEPMNDITIEGRFIGGGEFVDLATVGLSVDAFAGQKKTFQIRATAASVWDGFVLENAVFQIKS